MLVFSFDLPPAILAHVRGELSKLDPARMKVIDRLGIPDEVRIRIGFRDRSGQLQRYSLWEGDIAKQQAELRQLRDIEGTELPALIGSPPNTSSPSFAHKQAQRRPHTSCDCSNLDVSLGTMK